MKQVKQKPCWACGAEGTRFVQIWNPRGFWVLVDKKLGQIIDHNRKALPKIFKFPKKYKKVQKELETKHPYLREL